MLAQICLKQIEIVLPIDSGLSIGIRYSIDSSPIEGLSILKSIVSIKEIVSKISIVQKGTILSDKCNAIDIIDSIVSPNQKDIDTIDSIDTIEFLGNDNIDSIDSIDTIDYCELSIAC